MKRLSITLIALIAFGFLFLALPQTAISSSLNACCIVDNQCVGCDNGVCGTSDTFCEQSGSTAEHGICVNEPQGPTCDFENGRESEEGCCVLDINSCVDDVGWRSCISDGEPELGGQVWLPGASCGEVPQCIVRNIPTMSNWGLYGLAAVFGVVAIALLIIRRRQSEA